MNFKISEIFYSIQGEGTRQGLPCVFVRLQGCKLRCSWCDTKYALDFNKDFYELSEQQLIQEVKKYDCNFIEFTGGEPLEQDIYEVMKQLCDENYTVAIETSGYLDISKVDYRVVKILDVKCPDSKMSNKNLYSNFQYLTKNDEVKFVIASDEDYQFAKKVVIEYDLINKCNSVLFSPVFGKYEYLKMVDNILNDRLNVRFQIQLHKIVWEPNKRGV